MTKHTIDHEALTIIAIDENGEAHDLNGGDPCETTADLRAFVCECHDQGAYNDETRNRLLAEVPA